jgi:hypothetical protein
MKKNQSSSLNQRENFGRTLPTKGNLGNNKKPLSPRTLHLNALNTELYELESVKHASALPSPALHPKDVASKGNVRGIKVSFILL